MQYLLDCITTILNVSICFGVMYRKYELQHNQLPQRILLVVLCVILKIAIVFVRIPPLNLISSCAMIFLAIKLPYRCRVSSALVYSAVIVILTLTADALGVLIVSMVQELTISAATDEMSLSLHRHILNWMFQIIFARLLALLVNKANHDRSKWHEIVFYVMLVLFEVGVFAYVSYMVQDYTRGTFIIFMMLGFIVLDVYMMYILQKISHSREAEHKIALMQQQEQLQMQMYLELQNKYDLSCSVAHDIKRHLRSLQALVHDSPIQRVEQYLADLHHTADRLRPTIKHQNAMLSIILNILSEHCEKNSISLTMDIEDFPLDFLNDMDITTIFSNIFDNAVEACVELPQEERNIHIALKKRLDLVMLRIINSCMENGTPHPGIGLSNVKKAVEYYDGVLSIAYHKNQFEVAITIPIEH